VTEIQEALDEIKAAGGAKPRAGRDPVNQPMINSWVEAIGDSNPIYADEGAARAVGHPGIVAPPAMIQVWTMFGLGGERPSVWSRRTASRLTTGTCNPASKSASHRRWAT